VIGGGFAYAAIADLVGTPVHSFTEAMYIVLTAAFLQPVPGVNPWGEAVGELHSLPVQIGYETGATGLLTPS